MMFLKIKYTAIPIILEVGVKVIGSKVGNTEVRVISAVFWQIKNEILGRKLKISKKN